MFGSCWWFWYKFLGPWWLSSGGFGSGSACSDGTLYEVGLRFGAVLLVCASLSFDGQYLLTYFFITGECNRFW